MDMAVGESQATSISKGKKPMQNLKSLLTTIRHATDVTSRNEHTNTRTETCKVQMKEKNTVKSRKNY